MPIVPMQPDLMSIASYNSLQPVNQNLSIPMNRSKVVAIITGAISVILALAYLLLVQLLDFRGEMKPAPLSQLPPPAEITHI